MIGVGGEEQQTGWKGFSTKEKKKRGYVVSVLQSDLIGGGGEAEFFEVTLDSLCFSFCILYQSKDPVSTH